MKTTKSKFGRSRTAIRTAAGKEIAERIRELRLGDGVFADIHELRARLDDRARELRDEDRIVRGTKVLDAMIAAGLGSSWMLDPSIAISSTHAPGQKYSVREVYPKAKVPGAVLVPVEFGAAGSASREPFDRRREIFVPNFQLADFVPWDRARDSAEGREICRGSLRQARAIGGILASANETARRVSVR